MLIYDLEILKAIPNGTHLEGIEYCEGWSDHKNMGISVICAYDYRDQGYHIFCKDNFKEFQERVNASNLVIGFNSESFDDKVCRANKIKVTTGYDILRETYRGMGLNPYPEEFGDEYAGYGLNALAKSTLKARKTGHGATAPVQWQLGEIGAVIDYCLNDVRLTKRLFDRVLRGRPLIDPHSGKEIYLRQP